MNTMQITLAAALVAASCSHAWAVGEYLRAMQACKPSRGMLVEQGPESWKCMCWDGSKIPIVKGDDGKEKTSVCRIGGFWNQYNLDNHIAPAVLMEKITSRLSEHPEKSGLDKMVWLLKGQNHGFIAYGKPDWTLTIAVYSGGKFQGFNCRLDDAGSKIFKFEEQTKNAPTCVGFEKSELSAEEQLEYKDIPMVKPNFELNLSGLEIPGK